MLTLSWCHHIGAEEGWGGGSTFYTSENKQGCYINHSSAKTTTVLCTTWVMLSILKHIMSFLENKNLKQNEEFLQKHFILVFEVLIYTCHICWKQEIQCIPWIDNILSKKK